jgi:hypothetical protein
MAQLTLAKPVCSGLGQEARSLVLAWPTDHWVNTHGGGRAHATHDLVRLVTMLLGLDGDELHPVSTTTARRIH